jgi:5-methylcytosine-specific restriction endonuclease McrA
VTVMTAKQLRSSPRWKCVRLQALRGATHCAICGGQLVPDAPPRSPMSSSVDHRVALANGGAPFDLSNLRVAHLGCNARRGTGRRGPAAAGHGRTPPAPAAPGLSDVELADRGLVRTAEGRVRAEWW